MIWRRLKNLTRWNGRRYGNPQGKEEQKERENLLQTELGLSLRQDEPSQPASPRSFLPSPLKLIRPAWQIKQWPQSPSHSLSVVPGGVRGRVLCLQLLSSSGFVVLSLCLVSSMSLAGFSFCFHTSFLVLIIYLFTTMPLIIFTFSVVLYRFRPRSFLLFHQCCYSYKSHALPSSSYVGVQHDSR